MKFLVGLYQLILLDGLFYLYLEVLIVPGFQQKFIKALKPKSMTAWGILPTLEDNPKKAEFTGRLQCYRYRNNSCVVTSAGAARLGGGHRERGFDSHR